jgi:inorganic pyrophosphatase
MKQMINKLEALDDKTGLLNVIVETPKGSRIKYGYEPDTGFFSVTKALPEGMMFPFNFGFIPKTLGDDGDPLDMLILNEEPLVSGCRLRVKPIAIVKAMQSDKNKQVRNDRIIGRAISKESPTELKPMELTDAMVFQIEFFFKAYNKLYGQKFKVIGRGNAKKAMSAVHMGMKKFKKRAKEE